MSPSRDLIGPTAHIEQVYSILFHFQYIPVEVRRREGAPNTALDAFREAVRYGPMFGCVSCHSANFLSEVVELGAVVGLTTLEQNERFLNLEFIKGHYPLLQQLGTGWCCHSCKSAINAGRLPPLSCQNDLLPTWAHLHPTSRCLNPLEQEILANSHVFQHVCTTRFCIICSVYLENRHMHHVHFATVNISILTG